MAINWASEAALRVPAKEAENAIAARQSDSAAEVEVWVERRGPSRRRGSGRREGDLPPLPENLRAIFLVTLATVAIVGAGVGLFVGAWLGSLFR